MYQHEEKSSTALSMILRLVSVCSLMGITLNVSMCIHTYYKCLWSYLFGMKIDHQGINMFFIPPHNSGVQSTLCCAWVLLMQLAGSVKNRGFLQEFEVPFLEEIDERDLRKNPTEIFILCCKPWLMRVFFVEYPMAPVERMTILIFFPDVPGEFSDGSSRRQARPPGPCMSQDLSPAPSGPCGAFPSP